MKYRLIFLGAVAALVVAGTGCAYRGKQAAPDILNLTGANAGEIRKDFNASKNDVRMLLLLSPT